MNHSENIAELAAALSKAQGEMQAAIKDSINPFFKSKYADLGSVWEAARPVLSKNGLCVMQTTEMQGEKVIMVTMLAHTSGQWMKSYLPLNPAKNDSQGMGAAITYLRRYSLSALVGVVCDDDDDGETAVGRGKTPTTLPNNPNLSPSKKENKVAFPENNTKAKNDKMNEEQLKEFLESYSVTTDQFKENFEKYMIEKCGHCDFKELPLKYYEAAMRSIGLNLQAQAEGAVK